MNKYPYVIDDDTVSDGFTTFGINNCCRYCYEERLAKSLPFKWADIQYSFGYYAGKYCEECWKKSGFRDATDEFAEFDEMDAGESLDGEEW